MVRFQMKTSNRPQTIAEVKSAVDIQSFRSNPEWYELQEEPPVVSPAVKTATTKPKRKE